MKKHLYEIKRLDIPAYLKWWFIQKKFSGTLSEVLENLTSPITLTNSLKRKFKIFEIGGNSVQDGEPSPETQVPIQNVTGDVEVKVETRNLLNMSALVQGTYNSSSSAPTMPPVLGNINDKRYRSFSTTLKAGTYTICFDKANSILRDFTNNDYSSNNTMGIGVTNITNATFTIAESSTIYISFRKYDGTDWSNNDLVWLVSGSTATEYIEHEEQTAIFPLEEGQVLHKDDTIEDKIVQRRKTLVFNGTENWALSGGTFYLQSIKDYKISNSNICLCTHYISSNNVVGASSVLEGKCCFINTHNNYRFYIKDTSFTTAEEFKTFLAQQYANGTPVTLEYELETPIEIPFTEAQRTAKAQIDSLHSYKGTTHISSDNNPSPVFKIQYVKEEA